MTPDRVQHLGEKLRALITARIAKPKHFRANLEGLCAIASDAMCRLLRQRREQCSLVVGTFDGEGHCWVNWRGLIIDLTFTQFDDQAAPVMLFSKDAPRRALFVEAARDDWALDDLADWCPQQQPSTYDDLLDEIVGDVLYETRRAKNHRRTAAA